MNKEKEIEELGAALVAFLARDTVDKFIEDDKGDLERIETYCFTKWQSRSSTQATATSSKLSKSLRKELSKQSLKTTPMRVILNT